MKKHLDVGSSLVLKELVSIAAEGGDAGVDAGKGVELLVDLLGGEGDGRRKGVQDCLDSQLTVFLQSFLALFLVETRSFLHVFGQEPPMAGQTVGRFFFLRVRVRVFGQSRGIFDL